MAFLRDYQIDAIRRMRNGCILNGGTGSGKSRTSLAYYYLVQGGKIYDGKNVLSNRNIQDLYIITTAKKRDSKEWEKELAPFLLSVNEEKNYYKNKVVIDSWNNIKKYADIKGAFFIFDEDKVVGYGAWSKAFIKICRDNGNAWIMLSATPGDCWSDYIAVFVANGFYKNKTEFERDHVVWKRYCDWPQIDRYINTGKLVKYRNYLLIDMDFQRHTTQHHIEVFCEFDRAKYKDTLKNRWDYDKQEPIQNASGLCYALRKICNGDVSKQVALLEIVEKTNRVIVFYNFMYERDILVGLDYGDGVVVAEWNGLRHEEIPKDAPRFVYLVQYNAGAEGWNYVGTDTIVFYSQTYSYKGMEQAAGRIDRMNTPFTELYYYHLKTRSSIDLAIEKALKTKKRFNESKFIGGI